MTPEQDARGKRDGCECPAWVRCAHFEGQILWLADREHPTLLMALSSQSHVTYRGRWTVFLGATIGRCRCGEHPVLRERKGDYGHHATLPEAQAEFDRREAVLLGREPEPALP